MALESPGPRPSELAGPLDEGDRVYATIRSAIERGAVRPGQRLASERALATDLRAPRAAVRRALQRLASEGAIERGIGRAGSRVRPAERPRPAREAVVASPQDVLEARWAFEPGLVPLVIARATEDDFRQMEYELDAMAAGATQQEFREAGYAFHLQLARATRNPLLVDLFEGVIEARARAGWGRLLALNATAEQRAAQISRNRQILEALRHRDVTLATSLLKSHLGQMLDEVVPGRGR